MNNKREREKNTQQPSVLLYNSAIMNIMNYL